MNEHRQKEDYPYLAPNSHQNYAQLQMCHHNVLQISFDILLLRLFLAGHFLDFVRKALHRFS